MNDFRALCAEGVAFIRFATDHDDLSIKAGKWANKAHAALAEPEPEGPTKDELWELWLRLNNELPDRPAAVAEFWEHARVHTLALARWGNRSAPQPIPVSEPLPKAGDCDAEGRCWWGAPALPSLAPASWRFVSTEDRFGSELYWLPAHALPVPSHD